MTSVRTRFAPSPTGDLHLGNLRVAVFNYLFARHHGGAFVVRVEDTDWVRNREGSLEGILDDLRWAGLEWDEGPDRPGPFGPYRQSERGELHRAAALRLLAEGYVYRCFCVEEEREGEDLPGDGSPFDPAAGPGCPGGCRGLPPEEGARRAEAGAPAALRFRVPDGVVRFDDEIRGEISFHGNDVGDFVILRSDGRSTYNFAVVVDDVAMEITHVIRGAGHLSNTPKHALLFDALGSPRPRFAHLPMVLGADRRKLSKREGAAGVGKLQAQGYHPDAVVNYLSLLGWSPGDDREILSRKELIQEMTLERVGASDTVFDPDKLRWVSEQHIQRMTVTELAEAVTPHLPPEAPAMTREELERAVEAVRTRIAVFSDIGPALRFLHPDPQALAAAGEEVRREGAEGVRILQGVMETLSALEEWEAGPINAAIRSCGKTLGARGPALFHPLRLALTAEASGPELAGILAAVGKEEALRRFRLALDH
ncbi:MAG: glutamate--tRNA ligase [Gemmatimonadales bacterium]|nr:MAG: glutamate--tRNA ligase [Gemmatimonadales bacterium]